MKTQVENLPDDLRTPKKLASLFNALAPNEVVCVSVGIYCPYLDALVKTRKAALVQLELAIANAAAAIDATAESTSDGSVDLPNAVALDKNSLPVGLYFLKKRCCKNFTLVDAVQYWQDYVAELDKEIIRLQTEGEAMIDDSSRVDELVTQLEEQSIPEQQANYPVALSNIVTMLKSKFKTKAVTPTSTGATPIV